MPSPVDLGLQAVFEELKEAGANLPDPAEVGVEEGRITRDELYIADEVFLTGTAAEITPVREIDNRTIGNGKRGKTTGRIQKMFFEIVHGNHTKFNKWLSNI